MIEISLSFLAWLGVLFIQMMVHIKVVYFRKVRDVDDEPLLIERDISTSSEIITTEEELRKSILSRSYSDPALDGDVFDFQEEDVDDDDDDDDEPPNLKQRLSQTGTEMMSSCKSLEDIVSEQIQILAQ